MNNKYKVQLPKRLCCSDFICRCISKSLNQFNTKQIRNFIWVSPYFCHSIIRLLTSHTLSKNPVLRPHITETVRIKWYVYIFKENMTHLALSILLYLPFAFFFDILDLFWIKNNAYLSFNLWPFRYRIHNDKVSWKDDRSASYSIGTLWE